MKKIINMPTELALILLMLITSGYCFYNNNKSYPAFQPENKQSLPDYIASDTIFMLWCKDTGLNPTPHLYNYFTEAFIESDEYEAFLDSLNINF